MYPFHLALRKFMALPSTGFQEFIGSYSDAEATQYGPFHGKAPEGLAPGSPYMVYDVLEGPMDIGYFPIDPNEVDIVTEKPTLRFTLYDSKPDRLLQNGDKFRDKMDRWRPDIGKENWYSSIAERTKTPPLTLLPFQEQSRREYKETFSYTFKVSHPR